MPELPDGGYELDETTSYPPEDEPKKADVEKK